MEGVLYCFSWLLTLCICLYNMKELNYCTEKIRDFFFLETSFFVVVVLTGGDSERMCLFSLFKRRL